MRAIIVNAATHTNIKLVVIVWNLAEFFTPR